MTSATLSENHPEIEDYENLARQLSAIRLEIEKTIFGQSKVVDLLLTSILAGGHGLLVGVPGLAKTKLVTVVAQILGLQANRIQFTPDLMPSDILGAEILEQANDGTKKFRFVKGPVFSQIIIADEINRASPRTQSALLQAMQEYQVSIAGSLLDLPKPFHVLATQNPIEQDGTYPLPEAQLDRFLLEIDLTYPDEATELQILANEFQAHEPDRIFDTQTLMAAQTLIQHMPIGENLHKYIVSIMQKLRPQTDATHKNNHDHYIDWAPGPRASLALSACVRAYALLQGKMLPDKDDVNALILPVLKHRMSLNYKALSDKVTLNDIIEDVID